MKTLIFKLIAVTLLYNSVTYSQNGWVNQYSGTSEHLYCVYFVNENTGWAAGYNGTILKTNNGGLNWQSQISNSTLPIYSIVFKDANSGWAVGGDWGSNPLCQDLVVYLRTTNGGANWFAFDNGYSLNHFNKLYELALTSNNDLYVCAAGISQTCMNTGGKVAKSTNLGSSWITLDVYNLLPIAYNSVFFLNSNLGWSTGIFTTDVPPRISVISKTTNSGINWEAVKVDSTFNGGSIQPGAIRFVNENTGYVMYAGSLKKTTDAGNVWNHTDSITTSGINYFRFVNADTGWCIGYPNRIIRTINGGTNWTTQLSNTNEGLSKIFFLNSQTGWIAGGNGTILKTITGGLTSITNSSSISPSEFTLYQNYPNPFNPVTDISYSLIENGFVTLKVFDALGKEVATLVNEIQNRGSYNYQFSTINYQLSSGIYFYKLEAGDFSETKRMILLK